MLDLDKEARTADYNSIHESYQNCTRGHLYKESNMLLIVQANQQEHTSMVWPCHEERGRVNSEGCKEVKYKGKETNRNTKVARQHR